MGSWGVVTRAAARHSDRPLGQRRAAAGAAFAGSRRRGGPGCGQQGVALSHTGEWLRPLPLPAVRRRTYGLLFLQEPLLPDLRQSPGCRGRSQCPLSLAQRGPSPPHLFGALGTAASPLPATGTARCRGSRRCPGDAHRRGHALSQASTPARRDGDAAYLRARPDVPRACACPLYRGRVASRRRLAAGPSLPRPAIPSALAALPPLGVAAQAQGRPRRGPAHRPPLPQVSHRVHRQRDEPLPQRAAGSGLLLPLHRSAAIVRATPRLRWEAGDPDLPGLPGWAGEEPDAFGGRLLAAVIAARLAPLPAGRALLWAVSAASAQAARAGSGEGEPLWGSGPPRSPAVPRRAAAESALRPAVAVPGMRRPAARRARPVSEEKPCEEKPAKDAAAPLGRSARSISVSSAGLRSGSRMTCLPCSMLSTPESRVRQRRSAVSAARASCTRTGGFARSAPRRRRV